STAMSQSLSSDAAQRGCTWSRKLEIVNVDSGESERVGPLPGRTMMLVVVPPPSLKLWPQVRSLLRPMKKPVPNAVPPSDSVISSSQIAECGKCSYAALGTPVRQLDHRPNHVAHTRTQLTKPAPTESRGCRTR